MSPLYRDQAVWQYTEMTLLEHKHPRVAKHLDDAFVAFILNPNSDQPLWGPWVMHIATQVRLPRQFSGE